MRRTGGFGTALATVAAPITWGTTYVTVTETLPDGRPLLVAAVRVVPAGLLLMAFGLVRARWRPQGAQWRHTATLALFNFALFLPLLIVAIYRLPGGVAAAVGGTQPLLVALFSWLVVRRRPSARELTIGLVAAVGVGLVVVKPGADIDALGVLAALAANVSFSMGVVLTKRFAPPNNRLAATGWQLAMGGVVLLPLMWAVEGAPPAPSATNAMGFAYLSLIATGLAYATWFRGIERLPVAAPPLLGLAAPLTGAAMGWIVLSETLSPVQITGFVVTVGAIAYGAMLGSRQPRIVLMGDTNGL